MQQAKEERSLGELFGDLVQELSALVRQEIALATTEVGNKASRVGRQIGVLAIGGAIAYAGVLGIVAAVILALGQVVPLWMSALLVGLVVAGLGYLLVRNALDSLKQINLTPQRTVETLKDDLQWAKEQTR